MSVSLSQCTFPPLPVVFAGGQPTFLRWFDTIYVHIFLLLLVHRVRMVYTQSVYTYVISFSSHTLLVIQTFQFFPDVSVIDPIDGWEHDTNT